MVRHILDYLPTKWYLHDGNPFFCLFCGDI